MDPVVTSSLIKVGGSLLGGLFGGGSKATPKSNTISLARGARRAAEESGFSPLTMLQAGSGSAGMMGNSGLDSSAIMASASFLADAIESVDPQKRADAERQRALEKADLELKQIAIDQARSGVFQLRGDGAVRGTGTTRAGATDTVENPLTPGRATNVVPTSNTGGLFEIDNKLTGGRVSIPGDSEPWGIDELITAGVVGLPQVAWNWTKKGYEAFKPDGSDKWRERRNTSGVHSSSHRYQ